MTVGEDDGLVGSGSVDLAIRLGFLALVGYWSFRVIAPFATILLWSAILAVALYPLFEWLRRRIRPGLAAGLITLLCLIVVVGPVTWLGLGMVSGIGTLVTELNSGHISLPRPPEYVKSWPVVGERLHQLWSLAVSNLKAALTEVLPLVKPVGGKLLEIAEGAFLGLLELLLSIVIAGFLFSRGPQMADALSVVLGRALSLRGKELVQVSGATVRNISRGVIGIALLQAVLGGVGFLLAGVPAASAFAFVAFLLGILQIGPAILFIPIVIWSWTAMELTYALMFTLYMIPVGLIDNVLRPLLMARGLTPPMPVILIGLIGGTIAYGIVGLFFGPLVLSVAWAVLVAWLHGREAVESAPAPARELD